MREVDLHGVSQFLKNYPGVSIAPSRGTNLILKGKFDFKANIKDGPEIADSYLLEISVNNSFPQVLPEVKETERKIPRDGKHHVNSDETLCLGSPLRLLQKIHAKRNLTGFAEDCLVPYLYAVSHKIMHGGNFILGELASWRTGHYSRLPGFTWAYIPFSSCRSNNTAWNKKKAGKQKTVSVRLRHAPWNLSISL